MHVYDQHVHSCFSFDSEAPIEAYLAQMQVPLVTTEHLEMANPADGGRDDKPDVAAYDAAVAALRSRYPNQLLRGVEVGYNTTHLDAIYHYLDRQRYDLVLLGFHHDGQDDFQSERFKAVDKKRQVQDYYARMLAGVRRFDGADVLACFDYGLRNLAVTPVELAVWARPTLQAIFKTLIGKHMALEVNTQAMYRWGDLGLYDLVIPWYQALGGKLFTLGSGAHQPAELQLNFTESEAFLHQHQITQLAMYHDHQPQMVTF